MVINVVKKLSSLIKTKYLDDPIIISSNEKDIKTEADLFAHNFLSNELSKTSIPIFSEENSEYEFNKQELQWIIDPIDGTLNFSRGFKMAAISIALWENNYPILGVIQNLFHDEVYYCYKDFGSWKNNKRINLSKVRKISNSILATGFPSGSKYDKKSLNKVIYNVKNYKKVRMLGCASLMLCNVASGIFDVYNENDIYLWDVAAGLSIINEAGGSFILNEGSSPLTYDVFASNNFLINKIKC